MRETETAIIAEIKTDVKWQKCEEEINAQIASGLTVRELFYELWFPLLDYVNQKYKVNSKLKKMTGAKNLDPGEVKKIADYLWEHTSVIDEYLVDCSLSDEHSGIASGWKKCISGRFMLEQHLKKGSVFISTENEQVYMVGGIITSWEEMFFYRPLPILLDAALIPFKGKIISDGIVIPNNVCFGKGYSSEFKDIYLNAKKNKTIHFSL